MREKKQDRFQIFLDFMKKNGLVILAIIFIVPILYRWYIQQQAKNQESEEDFNAVTTQIQQKNPTAQLKTANDITPSKQVQSAANEIAHNLGTKYYDSTSFFPWLNPKSWTENDKKVAEILVSYRLNFHSIELLYYYCFTANRNLKNDIYQYLDSDNLEYVKKWVKEI